MFLLFNVVVARFSNILSLQQSLQHSGFVLLYVVVGRNHYMFKSCCFHHNYVCGLLRSVVVVQTTGGENHLHPPTQLFNEVHVNLLGPLPYHERLRNLFKGAGRDGIQDKHATCPTTEKSQ